MKQYSKRALQADYERQGNFVGNSDYDSNYSCSYDSEESDGSGGAEEEEEIVEPTEPVEEEEKTTRKDSIVEEPIDDNDNILQSDKKWLDDYINDKLKKAITKVEHEVDNIRNKKVRGAVKK